MHQTRLLARAFFSRLFESDLMPDGLPQVQLIIWGMLLAATPTTLYTMLMVKKYQKLQFFTPLGLEFDADRLLLISLSMIVIGVVGLFIWDGVFPDRRDVRILGSLPIPTHCFVVARLAALSRVYVLFATPLCAMQSIVFGLTVTGFGEPVGRLHGISAHFVTVMLACAAVFCALVAAQCLLLVVFGRRAAQAASVTFQVLFAVGLVQLLFFLPELSRALRAGGAAQGVSAFAWLPPMWFFALYQQLTGTVADASVTLARTATWLALGLVGLAPALYGLSYTLLSQRALEGPPRQSRRGLWRAGRGGSWLWRLVESPLPGAIRTFALRTLVRSRPHRMMFAVYLGFAFAIVVSSALSLALRNNGAGLWQPGGVMMSMPLAIQFVLLAALRVIMTIPSEPKARWIFRASEPTDRVGAVSGARNVMMAVVVLPTTVMALLQGLVFWTIGAALSHAAFVLVLGRLLAEIMTVRDGKLPFACTYFPGKSRIFSLWPFYLVLFFFYAVVFAEIDAALSRRPGKLVWFCLVGTVAAQVVAFMRHRTLRAMSGLRFDEEDPTAIFQGFQLSEGLAAAPPATAKADGFSSQKLGTENLNASS